MAVAPSKLLEEPLNRVHCSILHSRPGQSCTKAFLWNLYRNHVSSGIYYLPMLLLPLIINWRRTSRKMLYDVVKNYVQCSSFGACINAITFYLMCTARHLYGKFVWLFIPYLPCYIASQLSWLMPHQTSHFFVTGITPATMEALMRYFDVGLVHSRMIQTLIFMVSSVVVMHYQQTKKYSGFWFIRPAVLPEDYKEWTVFSQIWQGLKDMRSYLGIGLALDLINPIMKRNINLLRPKMTSFLTGYIGLFKLVQLLSLKYLELNKVNVLAAFLGGVPFILLPKRLTFMCFAVVTTVQVIWLQVCKLKTKKRTLLAALQRIPWSKILIPSCLAYLVHIFFYHQNHLNEVARGFIDCTCDRNGQRLLDLMNLPDINTILETVNKSPKTSFWF